MLYLFTFCVDIGNHSINDLLEVLNLLIISLEKTNTFELHIFTNFKIPNQKNNIIIHEYFDKNENIYNDKWLNLSFNKINIYKYLNDKYHIDFIWIDLDTIITADISYLEDISTYFIDCDGLNEDPHLLIINTTINIPRNKWIQGNLWKLNIDLYNKLILLHAEYENKNMKFSFDLQSLYTYYFYYILDGKIETLLENNIFIGGKNFKENTMNGLAIWDKNGNTHANINGLNNMYYECDKLKSHFYPEREIHIVSFTFNTLKMLIHTPKFKELFN